VVDIDRTGAPGSEHRWLEDNAPPSSADRRPRTRGTSCAGDINAGVEPLVTTTTGPELSSRTPKPASVGVHDVDTVVYQVIGPLCSHEAIMVTGMVFDAHPDDQLTLVQLRDRIQALAGGRGVFAPTSQTLKSYCQTLTAIGLIEALTVAGKTRRTARAFRAHPQRGGVMLRRGLYEAFTDWSMRHLNVSVQRLLGPPRGPGRHTPAEVILPWYRALLANHPQPTDRADLGRLTSTQNPQQRRGHSSLADNLVAVLTVRQVLIPTSNPIYQLSIAPTLVEAIRGLVQAVEHARTRSTQPSPQDNPGMCLDAMGDLLEKASTHSSQYAGYRIGSHATAQHIARVVASSPAPVTAVQVSQHLNNYGRLIGHVSTRNYLRQLAATGTLVVTRGGNSDRYTVARDTPGAGPS
jgi:hypothetical protein